MSKPYLLFSDQHFHNWTAYASVLEDGKNSRLQIKLDEMNRAYETLAKAGGSIAMGGGDMFHVRGKLTPSVLNPVRRVIAAAKENLGITTYAIAGNHDLESNDSLALTNAVRAVLGPNAIDENARRIVIDRDFDIIGLPWEPKLDVLRDRIRHLEADTISPEKCDLIIHAPMNGVLTGVPADGLTAEWLKVLKFRRVLVGHYHNHRQMNEKVWSIGATTHQTFNDVGTRAGFCLVYEDRVEHFASHAPEFVKVPLGTPEEDYMELADGNYLMVEMVDTGVENMQKVRDMMLAHGAAGVSFRLIPNKAAAGTRSGIVVTALDSLSESVRKYAEAEYGKEISDMAINLLNESREIHGD